jgi:hypothetical protein
VRVRFNFSHQTALSKSQQLLIFLIIYITTATHDPREISISGWFSSNHQPSSQQATYGDLPAATEVTKGLAVWHATSFSMTKFVHEKDESVMRLISMLKADN